ncbi:putative membrane protein [Chitinophaga niastensis]|uniref:Putative membrane protein n=1 Tax=Chitinophaga niastensis TaxID=536980 RepID=A0A2P8HNJ3_CHINA|nr:TMEM175 family protein [Chitinophaga niastensis]PSL47786.1 putative membrane protein [Chitinophaga niastensis]
MKKDELQYNQLAGQRIQRIEALSDGVFAIAMTLLVLDLKVPVGNALSSEKDLLHELGLLWPKIATYFVGFMTMGIFWLGQSAQFSFIERTDRRLSMVSVFFLAFVSLVPFTTAYLSEHFNFRIAIGLYWLNILLLGVFLYIHWVCAYNSGFVEIKTLDRGKVDKAIRNRIINAQLMYAGAALLCFISPMLSIIIIFLIQFNYAVVFTSPIKKLFSRRG